MFARLENPRLLVIRLLGPVELEPNYAGPLSRGAKEVLAYLTLHGSSARARVATAIWPESDESSALYNLRRALTDLRRHLGPEAARLDTADRGTIALDLSDAEVDLHSVRNAFTAGNYGELAGRCSASPLEGVSGEWATPVREAIRMELTQGLVTAARYFASLDAVPDAEAFLRTALIQSRHPESIWQGLVRLHSEAGDVIAARRILAECEASLVGESEVRPAPKATDLAPAPVPLGNLVGRHEVLTQLTSDLREFRLVTVCGTGGMGKTRVAAALAHRLEEEYLDGVAFVELIGATTGTTVREAIARALGIRVEKGSAWAQALEWLSRRRALLILDNAEHVLSVISEVVTELLTRTAHVRLLVTSRVPLGLPIERRRRLPTLRMTDAHALFAARASMADPSYVWSEESEALCHQLDGIPLAIELTAAQVGSVPLGQLSANLARSLTLDSVCDGRPERHQTMRAALRMSFDTLSAERRAAFLRLSVFVEGFTGDAAMAVGGLTLAELTRLSTASLIEFDGERYRMLEPVRQLAAEELAAGGTEEDAQKAHARWFAEQTRALYRGPYPYDTDPRLFNEERRRWQKDGANLEAALRQLDRQGLDRSDEAFSIWLVRIWFRLLDHSAPSAQAWLGKLEAMPGDSIRSAVTAHWWLAVGLYSTWNDEGERARALLDRLSDVARQRGYLDVFAHSAMAVGVRTRPGLDPGTVGTGYDVAIQTFERIGALNEARFARVLRAMYQPLPISQAEIWTELDRLATESLAFNDVRTHVVALRALSEREATWAEQQAMLLKAVRLQRSVGHWAEVHTLRSISMAARALGTPEDEIEAWKEAIRRGEEIGYLGTLAEAHLELARAYLRGGQETAMWNSMARSVQLIRAQDRPGFLHLAFVHLADLLRISGDQSGCDEVLGYLKRAANVGAITVWPKFDELHPGFSNPGFTAGTGMFAAAEDIVGWVEIRAMLGSDGPMPSPETSLPIPDSKRRLV